MAPARRQTRITVEPDRLGYSSEGTRSSPVRRDVRRRDDGHVNSHLRTKPRRVAHAGSDDEADEVDRVVYDRGESVADDDDGGGEDEREPGLSVVRMSDSDEQVNMIDDEAEEESQSDSEQEEDDAPIAPSRSRKRRRIAESSEEEDSGDNAAEPKPATRHNRSNKDRKAASKTGKASAISANGHGSTKSTHKRTPKPAKLPLSSEAPFKGTASRSSARASTSKEPTSSAKRRGKWVWVSDATADDDDDDGDEDGGEANELVEHNSSGSSGSDEEQETPPKHQRKRRKRTPSSPEPPSRSSKRNGKGRLKSRQKTIISSEDENKSDESNSDIVAFTRRRSKGKGKQKADSPLPQTKKSPSRKSTRQTRRGKTAGTRSKRQVDGSEEDRDDTAIGDVLSEADDQSEDESQGSEVLVTTDEDEDEDDLSISGEETIQESRLRTLSSPKNVSKFAALRAMRAEKNEKIQRAAEAKRKGVIVISDDDDENAETDEGQRSNVAGGSSAKKSASYRARYLGNEESSHDEDGTDENGTDSNEHDSDERSSASGAEGHERGRRRRRRRRSVQYGSDLDRDEEDFIVDEDDDEEARRVVAEFRNKISTGAQGQMYYLKTYLQWLVHLIVCPRVDWLEEDEAFRVAEKAVSGRLQDLLHALIGSSAWRTPFRKALEARPYYDMLDLNAFERGSACEACTMGRQRHSSLLITFRGALYNRKTFEILPEDSDDDEGERASSESDSDDSEMSRRRRRSDYGDGQSKQLSFNVGSSCAGRAQVYHELHHWGFTTHERMTNKLESIRTVFPDAVNVRDAKSRCERKRLEDEQVERDRREADRCATILDGEGTISEFAKQLDREIKRAVDAYARAKA